MKALLLLLSFILSYHFDASADLRCQEAFSPEPTSIGPMASESISMDIDAIRSEALGAVPGVQDFFENGDYQTAAFLLEKEGFRGLARNLEQWIERELREGELRFLEPLPESASWAFLVTYQSGLKAVLKLSADFPRQIRNRHFINAKHEVATYKFDRLIQRGATPVTVLRNGIDLRHATNGMFEIVDGSLQAYVSKIGHEPWAVQMFGENWKVGLKRVRILDYLINNHDRHVENMLRSFGFIAAIDNGGAFQLEGQERGRVSPPTLNQIANNLDASDRGFFETLASVSNDEIRSVLSPYVNPRAITELLQRKERLLQAYEARFGALRLDRAKSRGASASSAKSRALDDDEADQSSSPMNQGPANQRPNLQEDSLRDIGLRKIWEVLKNLWRN